MGFKIRTGVILISLFLGGACAQFGGFGPREVPESPEAGAYSWSSFFNGGCGRTMDILVRDDDSGSLYYGCPAGEIKTQLLQRHPDQGGVQIWIADRLTQAALYRLSNSKCQASIVMLGSENATIQYPCALVHITVGYAVEDHRRAAGKVRIRLKPERVLVVYGDGTQEFGIQDEKLVPRGPFEPFKSKPPPRLTL